MTSPIKRVGRRVILTNQKSIKHRQAGGMKCVGVIVSIDEDRMLGSRSTPIEVKFDGDNWTSWRGRNEVRVISL